MPENSSQTNTGTLIQQGDIPTPQVSAPVPPQVQNKLDDIHKVIVAVVIVLVVAFVTLLVAVIGIILDSQRFNSTLYKEYSDKINTNEMLLKTNKELLERNEDLLKNIKNCFEYNSNFEVNK